VVFNPWIEPSRPEPVQPCRSSFQIRPPRCSSFQISCGNGILSISSTISLRNPQKFLWKSFPISRINLSFFRRGS
ncbi:Os05g0248301, partial [Oryza sativa Japonica Group]